VISASIRKLPQFDSDDRAAIADSSCGHQGSSEKSRRGGTTVDRCKVTLILQSIV